MTGDRLIQLASYETGLAYLVASGPARGTVWFFTRAMGRNAGFIIVRLADSFREFYEDYLTRWPWESNPHKTSEGVLDPRADGDAVLSRAHAQANDPQVYIDLYMLGEDLHDWPGLLAVLEYVISKSPPSSLLAHLRGSVLTNLGRHEEAVTALRKAVEMDPSHEDILNDGWLDEPPRLDLSDALELLGRLDEALEVLAGLPPCPKKFARMGRIYFRQGRLDEAIEVCGIARFLANLIDRDFVEADALNTRGDAFRRLGRFDEARRDYARAHFSSDPSLASRNLAALCCNEGRPEEALIHLRRALTEAYDKTDYMTDPDFAPARALPGFVDVVARATWRVPR